MGRNNEALWKSIVSSVKSESTGGTKSGQWSARKAQIATRRYQKRMGGKSKAYSGGKSKSQRSLSRWTAQKWRTSNGKKASGRKGGTARYLPSSAWSRLSPAQKRATNAKKKAASRRGQQFVGNTKAAASASRRARGVRKRKKKK